MDLPTYVIARDNDLARLEATVNERIDEGYALAGHLFAVTPAQGGVLYVQPLIYEYEDDDVVGDDEEDQEAEAAALVSPRRGR
jgi:hypothetical protein